jgi:pimeloyl-ACP methyl ester carboxylesterase
MTLLERMTDFSDRFGKQVSVNGISWRYYRLGQGAPLLWLTGGLRRAQLGFAFLERLGRSHAVIAPNYPAVQSIGEYLAAFDAILQAEGIDRFVLGGQSYGGMLAQAYLAHRWKAVERIVLSSSGPADYGKAWLPAEYAAIALIRLLPEKRVKNLLAGGLLRAIRLPEAERAEWEQVIRLIIDHDLRREDVISHFAVAADLARSGMVTPAAFQDWTGRVIVISAENDPTQSKKDIPRHERLFGRPVNAIDMGDMGHTALLFNPDRFTEMLEKALT